MASPNHGDTDQKRSEGSSSQTQAESGPSRNLSLASTKEGDHDSYCNDEKHDGHHGKEDDTSSAESFHKAGNDADTDDDDDDDLEELDSDYDYDGHRPTALDMRLSRARSAATVRTTNSHDINMVNRTSTIISRIRSRPAVPAFSHPLSTVPTAPEVLVDFDGPNDPYKPINWPVRKKAMTTMLYGLVTMSATWASACYSAGTSQISETFHVSHEVAVLGTALYLLGFGVGPLLWAPLSEVYGRRMAVLPPVFISACFSFGSATSKDFQTLMLTRFWGAFFASAPVTNTGGVLGDLYGPAQRGIGLAGYAMAVVGGPALGMDTFSLPAFPYYILPLPFFL